MSNFTEEYYKNTSNLPPSPLLIEALGYLESNGKTALDLGCGAGRDTKLLLEKGFQVTAMDSEASSKKYIDQLKPSSSLTYTISTFEDFKYEHYDLINARYSLPFNPSRSFPSVMNKIIKSLNPGSIFVGQFFGVNDAWNVPTSNMTFLEKQGILDYLSSLEILILNEKDEDGALANGSAKHWHVFDVIARKN